MAEPSRGDKPLQPKDKTFFERLLAFMTREPDSREDLLNALHEAHRSDLLDADAMSMIEGVLQVSELRARDLMVPRTRMDVVDITEPPETWIEAVIASGHSRFPAIEGDRDHVVGILLAKDLLRHYAQPGFDPRAALRPALFIPESKPTNVLLRDFRANRNHMAIVVDEYGSVAGLITIEDVLEQIVGDIDDEHDVAVAETDIVLEREGRWRVRALTEIAKFNETFGTVFSDEDYDTLGGLVTGELGHVPQPGEALELDGWRFTVVGADARQVELFAVERVAGAPAADGDAR